MAHSRVFLSLFILLFSCYGGGVHARGRRLCTVSEPTLLKAMPASRAQTTAHLGKNIPLKQVRQIGSWLWVDDSRGFRHYVRRSDVVAGSHCAVVRFKKVFAYDKSPRTGKRKRTTSLKRGEGVQIIQRRGAWVKVKASHKGTLWIVGRSLRTL